MKKLLLCALLLSLVGCTQTQDINQEQTPVGDTNPPIINVKSFIFETIVGNPINIETATAWDNEDGTCDVRVDGQVNFNKVGEYYLKYTATDLSGNKSEISFTVIVKEKVSSETTNPNNNSNEIIGCTVEKAYDPTLPCEHMITDISEMLEIYQDKSGYQRCIAKVESLNEEGYSCEKLYRNDQTIWGYGLQKK